MRTKDWIVFLIDLFLLLQIGVIIDTFFLTKLIKGQPTIYPPNKFFS
jgi:hypothetical protein